MAHLDNNGNEGYAPYTDDYEVTFSVYWVAPNPDFPPMKQHAIDKQFPDGMDENRAERIAYQLNCETKGAAGQYVAMPS